MKRFILSRKIKISSLVFFFSFSLCALYVGSYLVASTIYSNALNDFDLLTIISDRAPCVARSFFFLYYTYYKNETIYIEGEDAISYIIPKCLKIGERIREVKKQNDHSYKNIAQVMNTADSDRFCDYYFTTRKFNGKSFNESDLNDCKTINKQSLLLGLSQNINGYYQHIQQKSIEFHSEATNRTLQYLQSQMYDTDTEDLIYLYFVYLGPVLDEVQIFTNKQLYLILA